MPGNANQGFFYYAFIGKKRFQFPTKTMNYFVIQRENNLDEQ